MGKGLRNPMGTQVWVQRVRACLAAVLPRFLKNLITLYSISELMHVMICDAPTYHT